MKRVDIKKEYLDQNKTIQDAVNDLTAQGGGTLYFPTSNYSLSSPLVVDAQYTWSIIGDGAFASTISTLGKDVIIFDNSNNPNGRSQALSVTGMSIQSSSPKPNGIALNFKGAGQTNTPNNSILDKRCQFITIRDCWINNFDRAIFLDKCTNFEINDCFLYNNNIGIYANLTGDGFVRGMKTGSNKMVAIQIKGSKGTPNQDKYGAWDEGFNIYGCVFNGDVAGVLVENYNYFWITGCQIGSTTNVTIKLGENVADGIIIGNEISNTVSSGDGITFHDRNPPQLCVVQGNFINNCRNYGIVLRGRNHTVTGNVFNGNGGGANDDGLGGIDIQLNNAQGCIVSNNSCNSTPASKYSIDETSGSDVNVISNNVCMKSVKITGSHTRKDNNIEDRLSSVCN